MRLALVAGLAAPAAALLHKKHGHKAHEHSVISQTAAHRAAGEKLGLRGLKTDADVEMEKKRMNEEMQKMNDEKAQIDAKLKEAGAYDALHKSSLQGETGKFQKEYTKMKEDAHKKSLHLTQDQALDMLKSKIPEGERKQLSLIMQGGKAKEEDKTMYVKAVTTLNDMYLSIDDERITTLTTCSVELFDAYRTIYWHFDTIRQLSTMIGEAWSDIIKAANSRWMTWFEKKKEEEKLDGIKAAQATYMGQLEEDLANKQADVALYKFIIGAVEGQCNKAGLLQMDKKSVEARQKCSEHCAAQGQSTVNSALLNVFADPQVMEQAQKNLGEHAQKSLAQTVKNIRAAQHEEVASKYSSFLQKSSKPSQPWVISDGQGCGCGTIEDMGCDTMLTLIGQELECNKQRVREQEGVIQKQEDEDKKAREEQNDVIESLEKTMENQYTLIVNSHNEMMQYYPARWQHIWKLIHFWWGTREKRFACYLKLFELENNYFCAIKHIRGYMRDLALEAFGAEKDAVQDCQADDHMFPTGDCLYPGGQEHVDCIDGDSVPSDPDKLPKQDWTRTLIAAPDQDEKLTEAMGNTTIAMPCPNTMVMNMKCNTFLCPSDCEVSEWSDFSTCTSDCDGGYQQRTRQIIKTPRNGGAKCPDTSESQDCNTHPCDVDCVLHEDWSADKGCLQACTYFGENRFELLHKHIKEEAQGKGECPEKHHESRVMESPCAPRSCNHDEVCNDVMDLVIAYECSATVSRLGCWFMASFVVQLLQKMPSVSWGLPTLKIALVKFGNGMSKKVPGTKDSYYVQEAVQLSPLTTETGSLPGRMYGDIIGLWTGKSKYHLGFNNIGQAFKLAQSILDDSDRTEGSVIADKKLLVLTKGKRAGCTVVKGVAEGMKEKDIAIDLILFSQTYHINPAEYEVLEEAVSFPHKAHMHVFGAMSKLNDWGYRYQMAQRIIPKVCPDAISPWKSLQTLCDQRVQLLHRGRTCHNWTKKLSDGVVTLSECRNKAFEKGYKGFVYTDVSGDDAATECNCVTHPEDGKKAQVNEKKQAIEETCTHVPDYGKDKPEEHKGWMKQELAAGNGDLTSHYAVLESGNDCPRAWGSYRRYMFQNTYKPEAFSVSG